MVLWNPNICPIGFLVKRQMFEDGVKVKGQEDNMRVLDLSEMIVQNIEIEK